MLSFPSTLTTVVMIDSIAATSDGEKVASMLKTTMMSLLLVITLMADEQVMSTFSAEGGISVIECSILLHYNNILLIQTVHNYIRDGHTKLNSNSSASPGAIF